MRPFQPSKERERESWRKKDLGADVISSVHALRINDSDIAIAALQQVIYVKMTILPVIIELRRQDLIVFDVNQW